MGRVGLAFKILFSGATAKQVLDALTEESVDKNLPAPEPEPPKPSRSEAVTLLSALQREARFVDFIKEPIDGFNDAQVGAAVREVHRGCKEVIERMFAPTAVIDDQEGAKVDVADAASGRYRLTGNVSQSSGAASGELMHHGWVAAKADVPEWSGDNDSLDVITPAEVQVS